MEKTDFLFAPEVDLLLQKSVLTQIKKIDFFGRESIFDQKMGKKKYFLAKNEKNRFLAKKTKKK